MASTGRFFSFLRDSRRLPSFCFLTARKYPNLVDRFSTNSPRFLPKKRTRLSSGITDHLGTARRAARTRTPELIERFLFRKSLYKDFRLEGHFSLFSLIFRPFGTLLSPLRGATRWLAAKVADPRARLSAPRHSGVRSARGALTPGLVHACAKAIK